MYQVQLCGKVVCEVMNVSEGYSNVFYFYFWHLRLGHISKERIGRLIKASLLEVKDPKEFSTCECCLFG